MAIRDGVSTSTVAEHTQTSRNSTLGIVALVLGDIIVFLVFATVGRRSHGEAASLSTALDVMWTALPFLLGWFLVSPFIGAFRRTVIADPRKMATRTALAWLASWPVAMLLRGLLVDHAIPPLTFWLVALLANSIFLQIWRFPFALVAKRMQRA
jgi:Kef-type K+ transport system membrane component KefB